MLPQLPRDVLVGAVMRMPGSYQRLDLFIKVLRVWRSRKQASEDNAAADVVVGFQRYYS